MLLVLGALSLDKSLTNSNCRSHIPYELCGFLAGASQDACVWSRRGCEGVLRRGEEAGVVCFFNIPLRAMEVDMLKRVRPAIKIETCSSLYTLRDRWSI